MPSSRTDGSPGRFPAECRSLPNWIVWRIQTRKGRRTKVPYSAKTGKFAKSTDPETWTTYQAAQRAVSEERYDGLGFVFDGESGLCGVDLDSIPRGRARRKKIVDFVKALGTYAEWSPSGNGIHVIGYGYVGTGHKTNNITKLGCAMEIYDRVRFFTVTGNQVDDTSRDVNRIDPDPFIKWIEEAKGKTAKKEIMVQGEFVPDSRHDQLVTICATYFREGMERKVAEALLRSEARVIGLPKREQDEVGRIVEFIYGGTRSKDVQVKRGVDQMLIRDEVKSEYYKVVEGDLGQPERKNMSDLLKLPDEPVEYAIDELCATGGNVLLTAMNKAGKTSLALSLCKALCDDEPFLNYFNCELRAESRVVFLNYELTEGQFVRWVRKTGVKQADRMDTIPLRGMPNPLADRDGQTWLVEELRETNASWIIIDPAAMAMLGIVESENDSMQMARFQGIIDRVKKRANVDQMVLINHMGWASLGHDVGRSRGSTRQEDWTDTKWRLTMDGEGGRAPRALTAYGRDVDLAPIELTFNKETGLYVWDGQTRSEARIETDLREYCSKLRAWYRERGEWPTSDQARKLMGGKTSRANAKMDAAVGFGYVERLPDGARVRMKLTSPGNDLVSGAPLETKPGSE